MAIKRFQLHEHCTSLRRGDVCLWLNNPTTSATEYDGNCRKVVQQYCEPTKIGEKKMDPTDSQAHTCRFLLEPESKRAKKNCADKYWMPRNFSTPLLRNISAMRGGGEMEQNMRQNMLCGERSEEKSCFGIAKWCTQPPTHVPKESQSWKKTMKLVMIHIHGRFAANKQIFYVPIQWFRAVCLNVCLQGNRNINVTHNTNIRRAASCIEGKQGHSRTNYRHFSIPFWPFSFG